MPVCKQCELEFRGDVNGGVRCDPCSNLAEGTPPLDVSPLERNRLELVMAWRSHPVVYRHFRNQDGPLNWDGHLEWFKSRGAGRHDFLIHYDGRWVGSVNVSEDDEVGVFLGDFSARGNGVATRAVEWLCQRFVDRTPLFAEVEAKNEPSRRLFGRCGFERQRESKGWIQYRYDG